MITIPLKQIVITGLVLFLCVGTAWLVMRPDVQEKTDTVVAPPEISQTPVAFVSVETGESLFVTFGTSSALVNGVGYSNILLNQVESVSGAQYNNPSENLFLISSGDDVTFRRGRKILFTGKNENVYLPSDAVIATSTAATTTPFVLSGTYVWVETSKPERTIAPKKPGEFSVTFSDGTITGATDCNGFTGTYTLTDSLLSIGALGMTKKFCEGSQEMEYIQQFVGELRAEREGRTLFLIHTDGTRNTFEAKE